MMEENTHPFPSYDNIIQLKSRSMSDTTLSEIDCKSKWHGSGLPLKIERLESHNL